MEKDYSLLRPFNLEAASRGDEIAYNRTCEAAAIRRQYVAGPDQHGSICTKLLDQGLFALPAHASCFRMAPLCWVEGKPVYKGDVLYRNYHGSPTTYKVTVKKLEDTYLHYEPYDNCLDPNSRVKKDGSVSDLSWHKHEQKRKGWVNVFSDHATSYCGNIYESKEEAQEKNKYGPTIIDTVRIEWEE